MIQIYKLSTHSFSTKPHRVRKEAERAWMTDRVCKGDPDPRFRASRLKTREKSELKSTIITETVTATLASTPVLCPPGTQASLRGPPYGE
jgi:hypothetical protein